MANSKQYILSLFPDNSNNEISAADMRIFVNSIFDEEIDIVDIIDNLSSTDQQKPLSANQGRILDDKITTVSSSILTKENNLGVGSEDQVLSIDGVGTKVWRTLPVIDEVLVYDGLDSTSSGDALSAHQGSILDGRITSNYNDTISNRVSIDSNTSDILNINNTTIPDLDARITSNKTDIDNNTVNINNNTSDISTNTSDISSIDSRVSTNESDIITNNSLINTNIGDISTLNTRVGNNETDIIDIRAQIGASDISVLEAQITQNTLDIASNTSSSDTANSKADANTVAIQANTTNISANISSISQNTLGISSNTSAILTNTASINNLNASVIPELDNRISSNTTDIGNIDTRVTQSEADITSINARDDAQDTFIQNNTDSIDAAAVQIGNLSVTIQNNKDEIEVLQAESETTNNNVANNAVNIENNRQNIVRNGNDIENTDNTVAALTLEVASKEDNLGSPSVDGYVLGSLVDGTRVWYPNASSSSGSSGLNIIDNLASAGNTVSALSANMGYVLDQQISTREPVLQNPTRDGSILASNSDGLRYWVEQDSLDIDYGNYFGLGSVLTSISISPSLVDINNSEENGTAQLSAIATYTLGDGSTTDIDVTEQVNWTSSNISAFTVNSGVSGGRITCINGVSVNYSEVATATLDGVQGGAAVNIDNQSVLISIDITPNPTNLSIGDVQQMLAAGYFSHSGSNQDITSSVTWSSADENIATVDTAVNVGEVTGVGVGGTSIDASTNNINGTLISGTAAASVVS